MAYRISFEFFSERVYKNYGGRISVYEDTYNGINSIVTAHCNVHNIDFKVKAAHLSKKEKECPECKKEHKKNAALKRIKPWNKVLKQFISLYGNKFSYDEKSYNGMKEEMIVHCNDCGSTFKITPTHHLKYNNGGCPICHQTRIEHCSCCGKEIIVDRRVGLNTKCLCDECRRKNKIISNLKDSNKDINLQEVEKNALYCKVCGRRLNEKFKCDNDFCNKHKYRHFTSLIKYFGFDEKKLGTIEVEEEFNRVRDLLYDMYWNKSMSSSEICDFFKYPSITHLTSNIFKKYLQIPVKSSSQSTRENIKKERINVLNNIQNNSNIKYKYGHHITWNGKDIFYRSSYELDYAKYLDEQQIDYEVESLKIEYYDSKIQTIRTAFPDFYLPESNTIVEIKSTYTLRNEYFNMLDKVEAYLKLGYNFKLILNHKEVDIYSLIDNPEYESIFNGNRNDNSKQYKTKIYNEKWRWMNDGVQNYKIIEKNIDEYLDKGYNFGRILKKDKEDNTE